MAIRKSKKQMTMTTADIADVYANWPARVAPAEVEAPPAPVEEAEAEAPAPTGRTFSKPQAARQCEARARARNLHVRVAVVSEARAYVSLSQSTPGLTYTITRGRHGWACECEGYQYTGCCKHIAAVERRSEREGWAFGQVAPLSSRRPGTPIGTVRRIGAAA